MHNHDDKLGDDVRKAIDAYGQWVGEQAARNRERGGLTAATGSATPVRPATPTQPPAVRFDVRMRPEARQRSAMVLRSEGESAPVPVVARPLEGQVYALVGPDGAEVLTLPAELAQRYYDDPAMNRLRLRLRIVEEAEDSVRLVVDVVPGPTRQPMAVVLDFGGTRRTFEVPAHAATLRQLTSLPCEPMPRAALGLGESSVAGLREWTGSVEMRRHLGTRS